MRKFIYLTKDTHTPIMIYGKVKPSIKSQPKSGTWILQEYCNSSWNYPCFPEITIERINKLLTFVGEYKDDRNV